MPLNVSRIYRLLRLVNLLQGGRPYTANELAQELQVSRRTVFRDLNAMELAQIPYFYDPEHQGYRISRHFFLPPVNLTLDEAMAILVLTGRLERESNVPLLSQAARASAKLWAMLPKPIREHLGGVIHRISVRLGPLATHEGMDRYFDDLGKAIAGKSICEMEYDSFHEKKTIRARVHPLRLAFVSRAWYVLAWSVGDQAVRTYKLLRIKTLAVTKERFGASPEMQLDEHFGNAWSMIPEGKIYNVHLHFEPMVAGNVAEVQWHPTQRVEWNEDKSAEFYVEVDGIKEIAWWILGYGDQVKVIQPAPLAKRVSETARRVVAIYEKKASRCGR